MITRLRVLLSCLPLLAMASVLQAAPQSQAKAHQHGVASLSVAIDGNKLTIDLEAALDGLLGFERAPRGDAERKSAAEMLARLRNPAGLFSLDAAAQCKPGSLTVSAPVLETGAKAPAEHAELEAQFEFECARPQALRVLDVGLFDSFKRLRRINVQLAGPKGQTKVVLERPARSVPLAR